MKGSSECAAARGLPSGAGTGAWYVLFQKEAGKLRWLIGKVPSAGPGWEESEKGVSPRPCQPTLPDRERRVEGLEGCRGVGTAAFTSGRSSMRPAAGDNGARALSRWASNRISDSGGSQKF